MRSIQAISLKDITRNREYFPSPETWEDQILYFLLADRFSNGEEQDPYNPETDYEKALKNEKAAKEWRAYGTRWNGGTIQGIRSKIGYLKQLGITAIWISPVFKQMAFEETYHGYGIQNFLALDPHFGTKEELKELVEEAHRQNMYIILDIILNHTGNVFAYQEQAPGYNGSEFAIKAFRDKNGEATIPVDRIDVDAIWPDGGV